MSQEGHQLVWISLFVDLVSFRIHLRDLPAARAMRFVNNYGRRIRIRRSDFRPHVLNMLAIPAVEKPFARALQVPGAAVGDPV